MSKPVKTGNVMLPATLKSLLLHGAIVAGLVVSFNFSSKPLVFAAQNAVSPPTEKVDIVEATFIDSNAIAQKKREKAQAEAAARKKQQLKEQEQARKRKQIAEQARKKKQQEEQQKEAAKAEQERLNNLEREQQKEQQIAEQLAKQEAMREALQQEMAEQLAQEQAAMQQAQQRKVMSELEKYQSLITQTIMRNLNTDGGFKGKTCTLNVILAPNGLVLEVKAVEGNDALCRAAQTAVLRPDTLPVSSDPVVFQRMKNLNIIVRPDL